MVKSKKCYLVGTLESSKQSNTHEKFLVLFLG